MTPAASPVATPTPIAVFLSRFFSASSIAAHVLGGCSTGAGFKRCPANVISPILSRTGIPWAVELKIASANSSNQTFLSQLASSADRYMYLICILYVFEGDIRLKTGNFLSLED